MGEHERAIAPYLELAQIDFRNPIAQYKAGVAYSKINKKQKAIKKFEEAIRLNENFPEAYLNIAWLYQDLGDSENALAFYSSTIKYDPDNVKAFYNSGDIHESFQRFKGSTKLQRSHTY